jgi:hypothetical protein
MKMLFEGLYMCRAEEHSILFVADSDEALKPALVEALKAELGDLAGVGFDLDDVMPITDVYDYKAKKLYEVKLVSDKN